MINVLGSGAWNVAGQAGVSSNILLSGRSSISTSSNLIVTYPGGSGAGSRIRFVSLANQREQIEFLGTAAFDQSQVTTTGPIEFAACLQGASLASLPPNVVLSIPSNCSAFYSGCASNPCYPPGTAFCTSFVTYEVCTCKPGYSGLTCRTDVNECVPLAASFLLFWSALIGCVVRASDVRCASNPCPPARSSGCTDLVNGFACQCNPGYAGNLCQTDINEYCPSASSLAFVHTIDVMSAFRCASNPCQNGALACIDGLNGYSCQCAPGFSGLRCQTDVNECARSGLASVPRFHCLCLVPLLSS
jgi:hypothetical protein